MDNPLELGQISAIDFVFLLTPNEDEESRLGSERAKFKRRDHFFGKHGLVTAKELHLDKVLVKPHMQRSVILLKGCAGTAPRLVTVNNYSKTRVS